MKAENINKYIEEAKAETIEQCTKIVHDYYKGYIDRLSDDVSIDVLRIAVLNPQRELHKLFKNMKR